MRLATLWNHPEELRPRRYSALPADMVEALVVARTSFLLPENFAPATRGGPLFFEIKV